MKSNAFYAKDKIDFESNLTLENIYINILM